MPTNKKTTSKSTASKTATKPAVKPATKPTEKKTPAKTVAKKPAAKKPAGPNWKVIAAIVGVVVVIAAAICIIAVVANNNSGNGDESSSLNIKNGKGEEIATEYVKIDDKDIYIKVPTSFKKLSAEQIAKKYSGEVPGIVYSNDVDSIDVDIAVSVTKNEIKNSEIKDYLDAMAGIMKEISEVVSTDYYTVGEHNVASLKLVTEGADGKMYNHMIFFSYDGKLVLVSFNCADDQRDTWEKAGDAIIKSLKFEN